MTAEVLEKALIRQGAWWITEAKGIHYKTILYEDGLIGKTANS